MNISFSFSHLSAGFQRWRESLLNDKSHAIFAATEWVAQPWWPLRNNQSIALYKIWRGPNNLQNHGPLKQGGDVASTSKGIPFLMKRLKPFGLDRVMLDLIL